jgi:hypothetical protein
VTQVAERQRSAVFLCRQLVFFVKAQIRERSISGAMRSNQAMTRQRRVT